MPQLFIPVFTSVVSEGEAQIPSSLGSQREQEVMSVLRFITIHGAQSLNGLRGQSSHVCFKHIIKSALQLRKSSGNTSFGGWQDYHIKEIKIALGL